MLIAKITANVYLKLIALEYKSNKFIIDYLNEKYKHNQEFIGLGMYGFIGNWNMRIDCFEVYVGYDKSPPYPFSGWLRIDTEIDHNFQPILAFKGGDKERLELIDFNKIILKNVQINKIVSE